MNQLVANKSQWWTVCCALNILVSSMKPFCVVLFAKDSYKSLYFKYAINNAAQLCLFDVWVNTNIAWL